MRVLTFTIAYLNRQIILVLSSLRITNEVFVRKVTTMLKDINRAIHDNNVALKLLYISVDYNSITISLVKMILNGFCNNLFVASLLEL